MKAGELGEGTALILALCAIGGNEEAVDTIRNLETETTTDPA
ncbi:Uncharacterised protein [Mycobacteroides abscessus subsp. abscessus]|nr:hypothetical protein [Mycobacteroides abscessus]SIJ02446.1 Uncharacterised protein [Mycobacteroides abscessus subsp. abscessus]SIN14861.1 Uncharacterised protein [Mycobacteroides abscessus subsp. abscessus]